MPARASRPSAYAFRWTSSYLIERHSRSMKMLSMKRPRPSIEIAIPAAYLVQKLQIARRDLGLETAIAKLDKYHLLILDDLAYVTKDQAETSVLFELISARYERRSLLITANQPFGEWGKIFPDQAMTLAAIDRLVHHATILEMNVDSYRRKAAVDKARGAGRPPTRATIKGSS